MTSAKKLSRIQVLLLSLISSLAFPSHAPAQPVTAGKFTLSSAAKWGAVVLPAGNYTFAVEDSVSPPTVTIFAADGTGKGMVMPAFVSEVTRADSQDTAKGKLTLEVIDGQSVVTALYVEQRGFVLHYSPDKSNQQLARKKAMPDSNATSFSQAK
jgi:hypothetical protein